MDMNLRHGEKQHTWYRSDRFYHTADGWWFSTREHTELEPFISEKDAEAELFLYIRQINIFGYLTAQSKIN